MSNFLTAIVQSVRLDVEHRKSAIPVRELEARLPDEPGPSLAGCLAGDGINVIAEVKYASPSAGQFRCRRSATEVAGSYLDNGAVALSVITEPNFFSGDVEFLRQIRSSFADAVLLRKDFIVDGYQITEARACGASACLLIVSCLTSGQLTSLMGQAWDMGMDVLVEVHDEWELEVAVESGASIVGINNRNLQDFEVDLQTSFRLARSLEGETEPLLVSESGLHEISQLTELQQAGFSGFLIGSHFMARSDPGEALGRLLGRQSAGDSRPLPDAERG